MRRPWRGGRPPPARHRPRFRSRPPSPPRAWSRPVRPIAARMRPRAARSRGRRAVLRQTGGSRPPSDAYRKDQRRLKR
ncbi:MAG: hypothetical protein EXQ74_00355 [Thermoleophilia bacterium]|nr:hypothetical protein [Thermoleophilia bacterium]